MAPISPPSSNGVELAGLNMRPRPEQGSVPALEEIKEPRHSPIKYSAISFNIAEGIDEYVEPQNLLLAQEINLINQRNCESEEEDDIGDELAQEGHNSNIADSFKPGHD